MKRTNLSAQFGVHVHACTALAKNHLLITRVCGFFLIFYIHNHVVNSDVG